MTKRIRVSADDSTYYTLPGNKGELNFEGAELKDTIFGQNFSSDMTGLLQWTVDANGLYKGYAGYVATIKKAGTPTAMTAEAMSLVSGKTFQVTSASKRTLDRNAAITILDNAVAVNASNIESIDHLFGRVTFISSYTPTTPITVTANYLPLATLGKGNSFTLGMTSNAIDNTTFDIAQANGGHRTFEQGLQTVNFQMNGIYDAASALKALLVARTELIVEVNPDGAGLSIARGYFRPMGEGQSGDVGELEEETVSFNLSVPADESVITPFRWQHASGSLLNTALRTCLDQWEAREALYVQYLYDGTNGQKGSGIITDLTLTGGLEAMNDFAVKIQGSGATSAVP